MSEAYIDPFAVLGLERGATAEQIKRAYFTAVREHPPERSPEQFKRIRAAYERLRDPDQRLESAMQLLQPWPEPARRRSPPKLSFAVLPADVLAVLRALTELDRSDWRSDYAKVTLEP